MCGTATDSRREKFKGAHLGLSVKLELRLLHIAANDLFSGFDIRVLMIQGHVSSLCHYFFWLSA